MLITEKNFFLWEFLALRKYSSLLLVRLILSYANYMLLQMMDRLNEWSLVANLGDILTDSY